MDGPQAIIALVVVALILAGGALAVTYSTKTTADDTQLSEQNESTVGGINTTVTFPNSSVDGAYYSKNATVTNSTDVELDSPGDYRWFEENGTLEVKSQAAANETLTANYTIYERTERQQQASTILAYLFQSGAWIPMLLFLGLLVIALGIFGGLS
jgi:hypothetical protein